MSNQDITICLEALAQTAKDEIWEGVVEIFSLAGHPNAKLCYAWNFAEDDAEPHYVAVLELPPVSSPHTAVRAAIASGQKK